MLDFSDHICYRNSVKVCGFLVFKAWFECKFVSFFGFATDSEEVLHTTNTVNSIAKQIGRIL